MKLHDLRPAAGAHTRRTRVGRGIAAGGGKTAGRGTKGQKARAGGSIPAWFEGGQTPLHQRIPKLRGFKNPFKTQFEIVNLGRIAELVELGALEPGEMPGPKAPPRTRTPRSRPRRPRSRSTRSCSGRWARVRTLDKPLKVLGHGEIDRALFVVADAFSRTAVAKIEAAGGSVQVIELPTTALKALGIEGRDGADGDAPVKETAAARRAAKRDAEEAADEAPPPSPSKAPAQAAEAEHRRRRRPTPRTAATERRRSARRPPSPPRAPTRPPSRRGATAAPSPAGPAPEAEDATAEVSTTPDDASDAEPATKPARPEDCRSRARRHRRAFARGPAPESADDPGRRRRLTCSSRSSTPSGHRTCGGASSTSPGS